MDYFAFALIALLLLSVAGMLGLTVYRALVGEKDLSL